MLYDPETRRRYDRFGPNFRQMSRRATTSGRRWAGRGGGRGFRGSGWPRRRLPFGAEWEFQDVRHRPRGPARWHVRRAAAPAGRIPGADQEAELTLTVEDAYRGGRRSITLAGPGGACTR